MLTEEQLQQLSYALVPTFQQLEQDTISDIARRVKKTKRWTETAELQARTLKELGYSPAEIKAKVLATLNADAEYSALIEKNTLEYKQEVNKRIKSAIEEAKANGDDLISTAGNMSFSSDLAFWGTRAAELAKKSSLSSINNQFQRRLASELDSFSHSLGFRMGAGEYVQLSKAYNKATDRAITKVCSGAYSLGQAVQEAVNELEKSGIRKIAFASGVSRNIDTAITMSTRTTLGQMAGAITMDNAEMMEEDLVEVSSHAGARNEGEGPENHAVWQGKVYSISGRPHPEESARLGYAIRKLSTATGYPDNPAGLKGYNCRHSFYTFFEGISEPNPIEKDPPPVTVDGKEYDYYHATQKQRQLERDLRATKRQYVGGDKKKMAQIKMREQHYARFCEQAGLKQNLNALYVKGYKRDFEYIKVNQDVLMSKARKKSSFNAFKQFTNEEYIDFSSVCKKNCTAKEWTLIKGQIKDGDWTGYFQSPNSFEINRALRENNLEELSKHDIQTIKALQNVIRRNRLEEDTILYRNDTKAVFNGYFDKPISELVKTGEALGKTIKIKNFISTSFIKSQNLFKKRPVSWELYAPKGINIFANGTEFESEGLLDVGQEIKILSMEDHNGIIQIKAELIKGVGEIVK